jgi:hypothetical protein
MTGITLALGIGFTWHPPDFNDFESRIALLNAGRKALLFGAELEVRIHLPPAASPQTLGPSVISAQKRRGGKRAIAE